MGLDGCQSARMAHDPQCAGCLVQGIARSAALPAASLDPALQRGLIFTLPAKRVLYREGDPAEALYLRDPDGNLIVVSSRAP